MLLLPGSLPIDRPTLAALGENLEPHLDIAERLGFADLEVINEGWSSLERQAHALQEDLPVALKLAQELQVKKAPQYAIATPLYAQLGLDDLTVHDPSQLQLTDNESRTLCETAHKHLYEEGLRLHYVDRFRWLLRYKVRTLQAVTESPQWLVGANVRPNLPQGADARLIERWMNELQMLFYTHPINARREEKRLPVVNMVWLWGLGRSNQTQTATPIELRQLAALRNGDIAAWQRSWATQRTAIEYAEPIVLGDHRARLRLQPRQRNKLSRLLKCPRPLLETLLNLQASVQSAKTVS